MLGQSTATLAFAGFLVALGVSCGGVELESDQSAGASGEQATGGKGGTGAAATTGGTGAAATTGGTGAVQTTGGGPSSMGGTGGTATGGRPARGGSAGRLVRPTAGGTSVAGRGGASTDDGGQTGVAGEGGAGGQDVNGSGGSTGGTGGSGFTYPTTTPECEGDAPYATLSSFRCEDSESYGQGPTFEKVEGATTLEACLDACSARSDCTAVSDFLHLTPSPTCYLERASCEVPQKPIASEENGAVVYEKVCGEGDCTFERIPGSYGCGDDLGDGEEVTAAESLDDCKAACLAEPTCTAVSDFFWERDLPACYLNLGTCNAPVQNFQDGWLYVKCPASESP